MRKAISYILIIFCFTVIIITGGFFGVISTMPELLPVTQEQKKILTLAASIISATAIFIGLIGAILSDIIGVNLRDLFSLFSSNKQTTTNELQEEVQFEYIDEPEQVLPTLLPGPGLISDFKLAYQRRAEERDVTEELRRVIFKHRSILVSGVSGIGKTREIGRLLSNLIDEGYTVLRFRDNARFDGNIIFPEKLRKRIILLFDDIHLKCSTNSETKKARPNDYLNELQSFIQRTRARFLASEVYIILIARSDTEAWPYLQYPNHSLWKDIPLFEMPYPSKECQRVFVQEVAEKLSLEISDEAALQIAESNDGTFRNILQNMYRLKRNGLEVTPKNFIPKQGITWKDRYDLLEKRHGKVFVILFATIKTLSIANVPLHPSLIVSIASHLLSGSSYNPFFLASKWLNSRRVQQLISTLKADGDLIVEVNSGRFIVHETMLEVELSGKFSVRAVELIWSNYRNLLVSSNSWLNIAEYTIFELGQPLIGVKGITKFLRVDPNNKQAWAIRAFGLLFLGKLEWALKDISNACKIDTTQGQFFNVRGIIYSLLDQHVQAKEDYERASYLSPDKCEALLNRANLLIDLEEYDEAEKDLNYVIKQKPEELDPYVRRAKVRQIRGDISGALLDLNFVIKQQPKWGEIYVNRALLLAQKGDYTEAEENINYAVNILPNSPGEHAIRAIIAEKQNKLERAEDLLTEAIKIAPLRSQYYYLRSSIRNNRGNAIGGLQDIDEAIRLSKKEDSYLLLRAQILLNLQRADLAIKDSLRVIELNPQSKEVFKIIARAYYGTEKYDQALKFFNKHLAVFPNDAEGYYFRGKIHSIEQRRQLALADLSKAVELDSTTHYYIIGLAKLYLDQNNVKQALKLISSFRGKTSNIAEIHLLYIEIYETFKKLNDAKAKYMKELAKEPNNRVYQISLAYIHALLNDYTESLSILRKSISKDKVEDDLVYCQLKVISRIRPWSLNRGFTTYNILAQIKDPSIQMTMVQRFRPDTPLIKGIGWFMRTEFNVVKVFSKNAVIWYFRLIHTLRKPKLSLSEKDLRIH